MPDATAKPKTTVREIPTSAKRAANWPKVSAVKGVITRAIGRTMQDAISSMAAMTNS